MIRSIKVRCNNPSVIIKSRLKVREKNTSSSSLSSPAEYCLDLVRKYDHENYLCSLLLPKEMRSAAFAIRAFNVEISRVEDQAKEPAIARMRYKFWEDVLNKIYLDNDPPRNPVAVELNRIVQRKKLSKNYFKRLLISREERISVENFSSIESMESYSENSVSPVYYLLLEAHDVKNVKVDHAASHLGKAQGITNLIRSILRNAERRSIVIPQDIMTKYNLSTESVFRGKNNKEIGDAVYDISSRAKLHLDKARSLRKDVPNKCLPIFLPAIAVDNYLERLRRVDFDIHDPRIRKRSGLLPLKLYWNNLLSLPY